MINFTFDWSINLGQLVTVAGFLGGLWVSSIKVTQRLVQYENTIANHANAIGLHTEKLEQQDGAIAKLVGDVQRLIGRYEEMSDRRRFPRQEHS